MVIEAQMWKRPVSIILILRIDNSSIFCSFTRKYFFCDAVKKIAFLERDTIKHTFFLSCSFHKIEYNI